MSKSQLPIKTFVETPQRGVSTKALSQHRTCYLRRLAHILATVLRYRYNTFMQNTSKPVAHIIIGFIGSGKTTFARKLEHETGAIRFTKDEWMVRLFGNTPPKDKFEEYDNKMASLATDMALKCLKAGIDVIIDEGFWVKEHRDEIREKVIGVGAIPKLYYLEVPFEIMKTRTLNRSENPPVDSYYIDEEAFDQYWLRFRPPGKDEEFALINQPIIE